MDLMFSLNSYAQQYHVCDHDSKSVSWFRISEVQLESPSDKGKHNAE